MSVSIERVSNGYVVSDTENGVEVFEDGSADYGEVDSLISALWFVVNLLEARGTRYDARRVDISWSPGDKHMDACEVAQL